MTAPTPDPRAPRASSHVTLAAGWTVAVDLADDTIEFGLGPGIASRCQSSAPERAIVTALNALAELFGAVAFLCPPDMAADLICPEARREMVVLEQKAVACIFRSGKPDGMVRRYGWAG